MTDERDPLRLLDPASSVDPLLREVLQRTSTSAPSAAQLQALALKVTAAAAVPAAASAAADSLSAPSWLAKAGALKLSAALLIAGSAAWWGWSLLPVSQPEPRPRLEANAGPPAQPRAVSDRASGSGSTAVPSDPSGSTAVPAAPPSAAQPVRRADPASTRERERRGVRAELGSSTRAEGSPARRPRAALTGSGSGARSAVRGPASAAPRAGVEPAAGSTDPAQPVAAEAEAPAAAQAADSELTLLSRAQGLLARDAQAALEVMNEHARAYPRGEFAQEREALAIDALRRLGRRQELQTRARAFLQRYPSSPHRDRIESWLR